MRVFLDANVLFSASNTASELADLIRLLIERHDVVTSDLAVEEASRNIRLKRPAWAEALADIVNSIEKASSTTFTPPVTLHEKDRPILCTAIRQRCTHLATGDKKDFRHVYDKTIEGVTVVSLLRLAELLAESSR